MKHSTIAFERSMMMLSKTGSKIVSKSPKASNDSRIGTTNGQADALIAAHATPMTKHIGT
jgi:hypothetical protein